MISFEIVKKSKKSKARLGLLKTSHGVVETPSLVPVATKAAVKTLRSEDAIAVGTQLVIANTFHLHLRPGEELIKKAGGIHEFMNWPRPVMTDSGGYQVFSLGFGRDLKVGKIVSTSARKKSEAIEVTTQPSWAKITDDGVYFRSPIDGRELFLDPKRSIQIQEKIGADIIFAFDECTPPVATKQYLERSLELTHKWAKICIAVKKSDQALYGIVQGSRYKDLRRKSAEYINALDFQGFGIGGDLGGNRAETKRVLEYTLPYLDEGKPRHLLGIGSLEDIELIIKAGVDTFDCTIPTQHARHGVAYTTEGRLNLRNAKFLKDKSPLDKKTDFAISQTYRRDYIAHLLRVNEITALHLLTMHNLFFFNNYVKTLREKIKAGKL